jgi:hypothetical protein
MVWLKSKDKIIEEVNAFRESEGLKPISLGKEIKKKYASELKNTKTINEDYPFDLSNSKLTYEKKATSPESV